MTTLSTCKGHLTACSLRPRRDRVREYDRGAFKELKKKCCSGVLNRIEDATLLCYVWYGLTRGKVASTRGILKEGQKNDMPPAGFAGYLLAN